MWIAVGACVVWVGGSPVAWDGVWLSLGHPACVSAWLRVHRGEALGRITSAVVVHGLCVWCVCVFGCMVGDQATVRLCGRFQSGVWTGMDLARRADRGGCVSCGGAVGRCVPGGSGWRGGRHGWRGGRRTRRMCWRSHVFGVAGGGRGSCDGLGAACGERLSVSEDAFGCGGRVAVVCVVRGHGRVTRCWSGFGIRVASVALGVAPLVSKSVTWRWGVAGVEVDAVDDAIVVFLGVGALALAPCRADSLGGFGRHVVEAATEVLLELGDCVTGAGVVGEVESCNAIVDGGLVDDERAWVVWRREVVETAVGVFECARWVEDAGEGIVDVPEGEREDLGGKRIHAFHVICRL